MTANNDPKIERLEKHLAHWMSIQNTPAAAYYSCGAITSSVNRLQKQIRALKEIKTQEEIIDETAQNEIVAVERVYEEEWDGEGGDWVDRPVYKTDPPKSTAIVPPAEITTSISYTEASAEVTIEDFNGTWDVVITFPDGSKTTTYGLPSEAVAREWAAKTITPGDEFDWVEWECLANC